MALIQIFTILISIFGAGYSIYHASGVVMEKIQTAKESTALVYCTITLIVYLILIVTNVIKLATN